MMTPGIADAGESKGIGLASKSLVAYGPLRAQRRELFGSGLPPDSVELFIEMGCSVTQLHPRAIGRITLARMQKKAPAS
jgi:hypothetical protein